MLEKMRRNDRQLSSDAAMELLCKGEFGVLSTTGLGYPYAVPVNYVVIDNMICFHGSCEIGQKIANINNDNHVCFTVVGETHILASQFGEKYESVIVLGKASIVDDTMKERVLEAFLDKYSAEFKETGMKYLQGAKTKVAAYRIEIEQITGKARR